MQMGLKLITQNAKFDINLEPYLSLYGCFSYVVKNKKKPLDIAGLDLWFSMLEAWRPTKD